MKMILLACAFAGSTALAAFAGSTALAAAAQDIPATEVPQPVASALTQKYNDATKVEWELDGTDYEAEFDVKRADYKVIIDPSGRILRAKHNIKKSDLPQAVRNTIAKAYKGMRLDDVELIEVDGTTYYQVELEQKGREQVVVFSEDGKEQPQVTYWD